MDDIYDYTEGFKGSNARDLMEYVEKNKRKIEHEEYLKKEPIRQNEEMLRHMQDTDIKLQGINKQLDEAKSELIEIKENINKVKFTDKIIIGISILSLIITVFQCMK